MWRESLPPPPSKSENRKRGVFVSSHFLAVPQNDTPPNQLYQGCQSFSLVRDSYAGLLARATHSIQHPVLVVCTTIRTYVSLACKLDETAAGKAAARLAVLGKTKAHSQKSLDTSSGSLSLPPPPPPVRPQCGALQGWRRVISALSCASRVCQRTDSHASD